MHTRTSNLFVIESLAGLHPQAIDALNIIVVALRVALAIIDESRSQNS